MNDLTTIDPAQLQELQADLGTQIQGGEESAIVKVPYLEINRRSKHKVTKKAIPEGHFFLRGADEEAYAESVMFRPLCSHIQYFHWAEIEEIDPKTKKKKRKLLNKSIPIINSKQEANDRLGTIACGMPSWDERKLLDPAEQKRWRDMQNRVTRGLVTYTGTTADGKEVSYENQPCIMFHKNSNYSGFWNQFMRKLPRGKNLYEYQAKLTSEYQENGSVTWYTFNYEPDLSNPLPITTDIFQTMQVFSDSIKAEKKDVMDAYFKAIKEGSVDSAAMKALGDSLEEDFEDAAA